VTPGRRLPPKLPYYVINVACSESVGTPLASVLASMSMRADLHVFDLTSICVDLCLYPVHTLGFCGSSAAACRYCCVVPCQS